MTGRKLFPQGGGSHLHITIFFLFMNACMQNTLVTTLPRLRGVCAYLSN